MFKNSLCATEFLTNFLKEIIKNWKKLLTTKTKYDILNITKQKHLKVR
jgi:hypothetical protein